MRSSTGVPVPRSSSRIWRPSCSGSSGLATLAGSVIGPFIVNVSAPVAPRSFPIFTEARGIVPPPTQIESPVGNVVVEVVGVATVVLDEDDELVDVEVGPVELVLDVEVDEDELVVVVGTVVDVGGVVEL